ncbi:hypothetical protein GCM10010121_060030 [Streptomyces brasiliensis]|uniref:Uncharacterized protein n=1 Tax=Streptomyces brasiliensis TaxID=1954 RepID=A0A917L201_9ACTN|nr:hypothetical protein GCM10010121_060030 [Streptomyces brasiliensis]
MDRRTVAVSALMVTSGNIQSRPARTDAATAAGSATAGRKAGLVAPNLAVYIDQPMGLTSPVLPAAAGMGRTDNVLMAPLLFGGTVAAGRGRTGHSEDGASMIRPSGR